MKSIRYMGWFFYFCRGWVKLCTRTRKILHPERLEDGVVYISRHMDMHGPIRTMAYLPRQAHIWAFSVFTDRDACYEQFSTFTFGQRHRWPHWLVTVLSSICAPLVTILMRQMAVVPVYRHQRDILKTLNLSMECLLRGESLIIFPDIAYSDDSAEPGDFYMGYLHLGRTYYKKTGKPLKFIPIYAPVTEAVLDVGEPLFLDPAKPYSEEKERLTVELREFFRQAAKRGSDL